MTDELKALLKQAKSYEEAKKILEQHSGELTDEELEAIEGGIRLDQNLHECPANCPGNCSIDC